MRTLVALALLPLCAPPLFCQIITIQGSDPISSSRGVINSNFSYLESNKVPITRTLTAGTGLTGGGTLAADRTFSLALPTVSTLGGVMSKICSGTDKLSAIGTDGIPVCSADTGTGGGVTSFIGRTGVVIAASGDYNATQITFTPAGSIAATTTALAIAELDTEKQPLTTALTALSGLALTDDSIPVANGSTWQSKVIPSCSNATLSKLMYDIATNTFSCGVDQSSGGGGAPTGATYITKTADAGLSAEQALGGLATGFMKVTTVTGDVTSQVTMLDADVPDTITLTNLTQVATRNHSDLGGVGVNTHTQLDTYLSGHNHQNAAGGGQLGVAAVSATGTPSSSTFWRGDNTWATPAGGGGGGSSSALTDFNFSRNATTSILNFTAGLCGAAGKNPTSIAAGTVTVTGATQGSIFAYCDVNGVVRIGTTGSLTVSLLNSSSGGVISTFPDGVARLAEWSTVSAGVWATSGTDRRSVYATPAQCVSTAHIVAAYDATTGGCTYSPAATITLDSELWGLEYCPDTGSTDAYVCTPTIAPLSYVTGMRITLKPGTVNTGAATVNVAGLGVKNIKTSNGSSDPANGDVADETPTPLIYDGTVFRLAPAGSGGGVTDHTLLTNIGTNTHDQIDTFITNDASSAQTFTNKIYNTESAGNIVTVIIKSWMEAAKCNNATAVLGWDSPVTAPAVAACVTGTNTQKGVADFADTLNLSLQKTFVLPTEWTGNLGVVIYWMSATTTGNVEWEVTTVCTAVAETDDAAFNTAVQVVDTTDGTANRINTASISAVPPTGCAAGELMHLKIFRNADVSNTEDTMAGTARLIGVEMFLRRNL